MSHPSMTVPLKKFQSCIPNSLLVLPKGYLEHHAHPFLRGPCRYEVKSTWRNHYDEVTEASQISPFPSNSRGYYCLLTSHLLHLTGSESVTLWKPSGFNNNFH